MMIILVMLLIMSLSLASYIAKDVDTLNNKENDFIYSMIESGDSWQFIRTSTSHNVWDKICRLEPYSTVSIDLGRSLKLDLKNYKHDPSDLFIDEEYNALSFINVDERRIKTYNIRRDVIRFEGETCLDVKSSQFKVYWRSAPNRTYKAMELRTHTSTVSD